MRVLHIKLTLPPIYIQHNECPPLPMPPPRETISAVTTYNEGARINIANTAR